MYIFGKDLPHDSCDMKDDISYIKDIHWPVSQVYCQNTVILANHIIANDSWQALSAPPSGEDSTKSRKGNF